MMDRFKFIREDFVFLRGEVEKERIYLKPWEDAPVGKVVQRGERNGRFYESGSPVNKTPEELTSDQVSDQVGGELEWISDEWYEAVDTKLAMLVETDADFKEFYGTRLEKGIKKFIEDRETIMCENWQWDIMVEVLSGKQTADSDTLLLHGEDTVKHYREKYTKATKAMTSFYQALTGMEEKDCQRLMMTSLFMSGWTDWDYDEVMWEIEKKVHEVEGNTRVTHSQVSRENKNKRSQAFLDYFDKEITTEDLALWKKFSENMFNLAYGEKTTVYRGLSDLENWSLSYRLMKGEDLKLFGTMFSWTDSESVAERFGNNNQWEQFESHRGRGCHVTREVTAKHCWGGWWNARPYMRSESELTLSNPSDGVPIRFGWVQKNWESGYETLQLANVYRMLFKLIKLGLLKREVDTSTQPDPYREKEYSLREENVKIFESLCGDDLETILDTVFGKVDELTAKAVKKKDAGETIYPDSRERLGDTGESMQERGWTSRLHYYKDNLVWVMETYLKMHQFNNILYNTLRPGIGTYIEVAEKIRDDWNALDQDYQDHAPAKYERTRDENGREIYTEVPTRIDLKYNMERGEYEPALEYGEEEYHFYEGKYTNQNYEKLEGLP